MTQAQLKQVEDLLNAGTIKSWVEKHPKANKDEIKAFVASLNLKEFEPFTWVVERMVRDEENRTSIAPVYDLDYDFTLNLAIKTIAKPDFSKLFETTKTVKQIQDELAAKNKSAAADKSAANKSATKAAASPSSGLPSPDLQPNP
jgi:carboxyl-terminal processing protease